MFLISAVIILTACNQNTTSEDMILISTEYGDMKVKLYDETPLHKENILKLTDEGFYNDLLFHRVIDGFMIQGGDPESKTATPDQNLGNGGPGYQVDAEILPGHYHKKGVIAAARTSDNMNPERKSSGSQFYIAQGKVYTNEELDNFELNKKMQARRAAFGRFIQDPANEAFAKELQQMQEAGKNDELNAKLMALEPQLDEMITDQEWKISPDAREIYTTVGGIPHLDGMYTVFGEVVEGLDVIDKIAAVETNAMDRPVNNIKMTVKRVK
jgi:cyclophilin family peptidyl-prolyl cis-trans isomerase